MDTLGKLKTWEECNSFDEKIVLLQSFYENLLKQDIFNISSFEHMTGHFYTYILIDALKAALITNSNEVEYSLTIPFPLNNINDNEIQFKNYQPKKNEIFFINKDKKQSITAILLLIEQKMLHEILNYHTGGLILKEGKKGIFITSFSDNLSKKLFSKETTALNEDESKKFVEIINNQNNKQRITHKEGLWDIELNFIPFEYSEHKHKGVYKINSLLTLEPTKRNELQSFLSEYLFYSNDFERVNKIFDMELIEEIFNNSNSLINENSLKPPQNISDIHIQQTTEIHIQTTEMLNILQKQNFNSCQNYLIGSRQKNNARKEKLSKEELLEQINLIAVHREVLEFVFNYNGKEDGFMIIDLFESYSNKANYKTEKDCIEALYKFFTPINKELNRILDTQKIKYILPVKEERKRTGECKVTIPVK